MADFTSSIAYIGMSAYFTFKEPVATYLKNKLGAISFTKKMTILSMISLSDMLDTDLKNPYLEVYLPLTIPEQDYYSDLKANAVIISLQVYGSNKIVRIPSSYILTYSDIGSIDYTNKLLVIDFGQLPTVETLTPLFNDLADFIFSRTGVNVQIKETNIGSATIRSIDEYLQEKTIRENAIRVRTTLSAQLAQLQNLYNNLLTRLNQLGITLMVSTENTSNNPNP